MKARRLALTALRRPALVVGLLLAFAVQPMSASGADDLTVCETGCDHTTIQAAIDAASAEDVISVTDAVHTESDILVTRSLTIQGQGSGSTILQAHANPNSANHRVFSIESDVTLTLRNTTIRHGRASGNPARGGGIYNAGSLTLQQVVLTANLAESGSGGDGSYAYGGGIYNDGVLTVQNSSIGSNTAQGGNAGGDLGNAGNAYGGGIYNGGTLSVQESNLTGNTANGGHVTGKWAEAGDAHGGGLYNSGSSLMTDSTVDGNIARGGNASGENGVAGDGYGGGIAQWWATSGEVMFEACTISGNTAQGGDALVAESSAGNAHGGGMVQLWAGTGTVSFTNCTISTNTAQGGLGFGAGADGYAEGGGLRTSSGLALTFCTIASNQALGDSASGGGLHSSAGLGGGPQIRNCIFADNSGPANPDGPDLSGNVVSQDYNLIEKARGYFLSGTIAHNVEDTDPGLGPLQNNGGQTLTHALHKGSVPLDRIPQGDNDCGSTVSGDQRGEARPQATECDIGAFELVRMGKLELVKDLAPASDPGRFNLQIDGVIERANASDGQSTGEKRLRIGTHTIAETAGTATDLANYKSSFECRDSGGAGSIVLTGEGAGPQEVNIGWEEDIVCTIRNDRKTGQLAVNTLVNPGDDPGKFNLLINGTVEKADASTGQTTGKKVLNTGTHTVAETAGTNTDLVDFDSHIECRESSGSGDVVAAGSGYGPLVVSLGWGDDILCTIYNDRTTGWLEVVKSLRPESDSGKFDLWIDDGVEKAGATQGESTGRVRVDIGDHRVSETAVSGSDLASYDGQIECRTKAGTGQVVFSGKGTELQAVSVGPGEHVVCTILNTRRGTIVVKKVTDPVGGTGFDFTDNIESPYGFSLDDGQTKVFNRILPGTYTVTEDDPIAGSGHFGFAGLACTDSDTTGLNSTIDLDGRRAQIKLDPGETVTCTFENGHVPDLSMLKSVSPAVVAPGEYVTYTLVFANKGKIPASHVEISDIVPDSLHDVRFEADLAVTPVGKVNYTWDVGDLDPGEIGVIRLIGRIKTALDSGPTFGNTASITNTVAELNPNDNTSSAFVSVIRTAPLAQDDYYGTVRNEPLASAPRSVLDNDVDLQGDSLTAKLEDRPKMGELEFNADGTFVYTPGLNYAGVMTFTYRADDGAWQSELTTTHIAVGVPVGVLYVPLVLK
jgi:uncharacterized repeat protein (TIGR01451 family)